MSNTSFGILVGGISASSDLHKLRGYFQGFGEVAGLNAVKAKDGVRRNFHLKMNDI